MDNISRIFMYSDWLNNDMTSMPESGIDVTNRESDVTSCRRHALGNISGSP